jgi:hypothetical protein
MSGVDPFLFRCLTLAPASSNTSTMTSSPRRDANNRAASPYYHTVIHYYGSSHSEGEGQQGNDTYSVLTIDINPFCYPITYFTWCPFIYCL